MKRKRKTGPVQDLDEQSIHSDPIRQFKQWFEDAVLAKLHFPEAMTLATSTTRGKPSARVVLLKHVDEKGFVFYTNFRSRKGKELGSNAHAAIVFYWAGLERQVRIEGRTEKVSAKESNRYFHTRPRDSQISALVSPQSEVVISREKLEQRMVEVAKKYQHQQVPRPPHWGGYCLKPDSIEFWQGRKARLHDRIVYLRQKNNKWKTQRLAP